VANEKNEFDQLERELHEALIKRDAPLGFATRVMAQIDARPKSAPARIFLWRWITAVAVFAVVLVGLIAGNRWQQAREQRIAGEHARDQVILALRITGSTLDAVNEKVQKSGKEVQP
jgi:hypothetical protein